MQAARHKDGGHPSPFLCPNCSRALELSELFNSEDVPLSRNSFESVRAAIKEFHFRADDQILDRARDQDFTGSGQGSNSSSDVDRESCQLSVGDLTLTGVQAGFDLEPECGD